MATQTRGSICWSLAGIDLDLKELFGAGYPLVLVIHQDPVVQKLDSAIHRINLYPVDNAIGFPNTDPLDSDLSVG